MCSRTDASSSQIISCVSLGMFVIDEIQMPNRPPLTNVLGGSATFVTLGLRLFASNTKGVGSLVIAGDDFPLSVREEIKQWDTTLVVRTRAGKKSTRGHLVYEDDTFGPKTFTYLGDPLRASPPDLIKSPFLSAGAFHLFGTPSEISILVPELLALRAARGIFKRPFIVWEPLPSSCIRVNQGAFMSAFQLVDVFSPNHIEMAAIFQDEPSTSFAPAQLEGYVARMLQSIVDFARLNNWSEEKTRGIVVVRAAEHGALATSRINDLIWLPAFHEAGSANVVDVTGAGNTFLGGFLAGWLRTGTLRDALGYGHVAASFAVEQVGLPRVETSKEGLMCNGVIVGKRLEEYWRRAQKGSFGGG